MADPSSKEAPPTPDPLVRGPQQDRSRRTLRRILDASIHILEQEGPDALIVTAITKRARASVGSFYARFRGKEDLLRYVGEDALGRALAEWEDLRARLEKDASSDLRELVAEVIGGLARLYLEGAGRSLVLLHGTEDPAPTRRTRLEGQVGRDLGGLLSMTDLRPALIVRIVGGVLYDAELRASPYPDAPVLVAELVEVAVGYLGGSVRSPTAAVQEIEAPALVPAAADPEPWVKRTPEPEEAPTEVAKAETAEDEPQKPAPEEGAAPPPAAEPNPFDVWG